MATNRPAGYEAELRRIERDIVEAGDGALEAPGDTERITKYAYRRYQRAAIAGDLKELFLVESIIDRAIALLANPADLYLLKANLASKLHRLGDVRVALAASQVASESREGRMLLADLDFQEGRYQDARRGYVELLDAERSWEVLARLAHFELKMGDEANADRLYAEAEDLLTTKQMRSFAWLEVQRGFLDFTHGRYLEAEQHYSCAEAAYPGYWFVNEHLGELLGAQGRHPEAAASLEPIVASVDRPDLEQALAELYELMDQHQEAEKWKQKALTSYLESAQQGQVHFYHHLVDYFSDVAGDGARAVEWAHKDLEFRENFSTQAALAWALYRNGQFDEAVHWIDLAISSGARAAKLFFQAAEIHSALGDQVSSNAYLQNARSINPNANSFHIHH